MMENYSINKNIRDKSSMHMKHKLCSIKIFRLRTFEDKNNPLSKITTSIKLWKTLSTYKSIYGLLNSLVWLFKSLVWLLISPLRSPHVIYTIRPTHAPEFVVVAHMCDCFYLLYGPHVWYELYRSWVRHVLPLPLTHETSSPWMKNREIKSRN
jgi:hypothetical protein